MDKKNVADLYPLSPMQQGMLFHSVYAPESGVYIEQAALALSGKIDVDAFRRTWQHVAARHAILRTGFIWESVKEPVQVVFKQVEVPFSVLDWRGQDEAAQLEGLQAFLRADRQRGFAMQQAPLLRVTLIRSAEARWQMIWTHHHILLDGWSVPLLLQEVIAAYAAFQRGETLELPAPRPYRDYIAWLRRQDIRACEAYWRRKLAGFTRRTPLSMARLSPELLAAEPDFEEAETHLPEDATQSLQRLARQQQLTLNTIVQAAWAILLSRYSGEPDVVFGTTVSGRPVDLSGSERILGLFINTLPVRLQVPPDAPVQEWLRAVQRQQAELHQYEYSPLAQVQGWSDLARGQALFDSLFVFENFPADMNEGAQGGGVQIQGEQSSSHTNYPLTVVAMPDREMLLKMSYDAQWFDRATIERMLGHLRRLLTSIAAGPQIPVGRLAWTEAWEQHEAAAWGQAARSLPASLGEGWARVQIRDAFGELVPVGVPGQVWLQAVDVSAAEAEPANGQPVVQAVGGATGAEAASDRPSLQAAEGATAAEAASGRPGVPGAEQPVQPQGAPWQAAAQRARWLPGGVLEYLGEITQGSPAPVAAPPARANAYVAPRSELETTLAKIWSEVLGVARVGIEDNFFELGGDSILSMQVIARAHRAGIALTPSTLFEQGTIARLADTLRVGEPLPAIVAEQGLLSGECELIPIQHYFFEKYVDTTDQFNTSMLLSVGSQLRTNLLEQALRAVLAHHDALRLEFDVAPGGVKARYARLPDHAPFWYVDLAGLPGEIQRRRIEQRAEELQQSFDISCAPLLRMVYFNLGANNAGRLLIILHHLVSDGVSWRILIEDLTNAYIQLSRGEAVRLPPKTSSYRAWANGLGGLANTPEILAEFSYWRQLADAHTLPLPVDFPGGENLFGVTTELTVSLSQSDTQALLRHGGGGPGGAINALLLAGLARALAKWTGSPSGEHNLIVEMEGHGREDVLAGIDLSRTVGWFTSIFPQLLQINLDANAVQQVQAIQFQLERTPRRGLGYGLLRYMSQDAQARQVMQAIPQPQVNFNYLGQFGQSGGGAADGGSQAGLFQMADESVGSEQNPQAKRSAELYLVAIVNGGQLHTRWLYSHKLHRPETIARIANTYINELRAMLASFVNP